MWVEGRDLCSDEPFFSLLFWSMAGLTRCQCLEVLVLHRIIKMPNSLKRDPNLSLEKKTKMLFFVFYLRCKGTNRWEFYSVSVTLSLKNEDFTFYRESEAWWLYIYIWKANKMLMLGETFFPRSRFFFFKCLNLYLRWKLGWIKHDTRRRSMCVCCTWMRRGDSSWGCHGDHWFSHQSCIFIHRLPTPSLTVHNKAS